MKWFINPQTLEELKQQYKKLAMENRKSLQGYTHNRYEKQAATAKIIYASLK